MPRHNDGGDDRDEPNLQPLLFISQAFNRWLRLGEDLIYILAGLVLVGGALTLLGDALSRWSSRKGTPSRRS